MELMVKKNRYYYFSRNQVRWFPIAKAEAEAKLADRSATLCGAARMPTQSESLSNMIALMKEQRAITEASQESKHAVLN